MDASLSSARWVSELGMEDYSLIHQYNLNCGVDHDFTAQDLATVLQGGDGFNWFNGTKKHTFETSQTSTFGHHRPTKQFKTSNSWDSSTTTDHISPKHSNSSSSQLVSFEPSNVGVTPKDEAEMNFSASGSLVSENPISVSNKYQQGTNKRPFAMTRTPTHAQDHVMAERKRREKLSERFIALSAMIPCLKKMDKASVLGDAIKYLKQLQERVQVLEEQTKKRTVESAVFLKKSQVSGDDDASSCDENFDGRNRDDQPLPEIEARVSDKDVLIRIHCEKRRGLVAKIISEIESYNLSVDNSSALPFGSSTLDITIVAKMDGDSSMTVKDLVKRLRRALLEFM